MSMAIYHNLTAMQIQSLVRRNNKQTANTLKQITSGQKVTDAEDGASEYAISEKMGSSGISVGKKCRFPL